MLRWWGWDENVSEEDLQWYAAWPGRDLRFPLLIKGSNLDFAYSSRIVHEHQTGLGEQMGGLG